MGWTSPEVLATKQVGSQLAWLNAIHQLRQLVP